MRPLKLNKPTRHTHTHRYILQPQPGPDACSHKIKDCHHFHQKLAERWLGRRGQNLHILQPRLLTSTLPSIRLPTVTCNDPFSRSMTQLLYLHPWQAVWLERILFLESECGCLDDSGHDMYVSCIRRKQSRAQNFTGVLASLLFVWISITTTSNI